MASYTRYQVEVRHEGLHKYRLITGTDRYVVERKAEAQLRSWDEMWQKKLTVQEARTTKEMAIQEKEAKKSLAAERTAEAEENLSEIEQTLHSTLEINDRIEWDSLLDKKPFPTPAPPKPALQAGWEEPKVSDQPFIIDRKWHHRFFSGPRMKAEQDAKRRFDEAHESWTRDMARLQTQNRAIEEEYASSLSRWEQEKHEYELTRTQMNGQILEKKTSYLSRDPEAVIEYCDMVLSNSQYPDTFPQEWSLQYLAEAKTLAIDYFLPSPENVPRLREIKYVVSKDKFVETPLQEAAFNKLYDRLLYQIALRTIHELYESDQIESIAAVVFNGWVRSIDKGTGKPITVCVLSVQAPLIEFRGVDLKHVDPKVCFKTLKGVGSSQLHGLSPIAPILQLNKEDKRFVSSYSVVGDVDRSTNLAALDWEDFEHLIREVFEKEFSKNGGEVKITQASRDGGVDAVAFDPDPIRGGKIVIQAKRYTNTVGVSAVRDLYGTVLNEGATKGILVTTADYGPDAYAFARDKPLTLLSGSNLLHLLERHGHKATIDLKAAKQILADEKKAEGNA